MRRTACVVHTKESAGPSFPRRVSGAFTFSAAKNSPHDRTSTPILVADANVHFRLNLSPKGTLNHKRKWVITLAYDHF
ncbi:hypothetical protein DXF93_05325 [Escherichia coli]|nr:hypothetical protein DXF93_05325 [Escherichia coli]